MTALEGLAAPRLSICQLCLPQTTFSEDLRLAAEVGYAGVSIDEGKLGPGHDAAKLDEFARSGLLAAVCCPAVWSILPLTNFREPREPAARIAAICAGIKRLAPFAPTTVFCATGSRGDRSDREARGIVIEGLKRICAVADEVGVLLSLEPMTRESGVMIDGPIVATIEEALGLFADAGSERSGLVVDVWHLWDSPRFLESLTKHAGRITALQANDYREPRSARDRSMPGDGTSDVPRIFGALERGGFRGWYDLEVFSDELWQLPPREFMSRGAKAMRDCWRRQY